MKSMQLVATLFLLMSLSQLKAQQLNYQGIARNANGVALSFQQISLRLSIRDGSATGLTVYSETRTLRTNQFGLFTVVIGSSGATNVSGSFNTINWITGNKFLQVEIDPDGGSNFLQAGTSQLQSVPFAFFAAAAYPVGNAGGDLLGSTYPNPIVTASAITTNKIANSAITNEKISDAAVTNNKLANSTVNLNGMDLPLGGAQYFAVGTSGNNFNIRSQDSIHTFNIPTASATARGLLSSASFTTFTNKQDALIGTGFVRSTAGVISYDNTNYVPFARTINGLDLSSNRVLNTDNIGEGTNNIYFTNARSRAALTAGNGIAYNSTTGVITNNLSVGGQTYLSYAPATGTLTANAVDLSGTQVTGTLAAARFGALTGDVTTTAGTYATTIANNAITTSKIADNNVTLSKLVQIPNGHMLVNTNTGTGNGNVSTISIPDVLTQLSIRNQDTRQNPGRFYISGNGRLDSTLTTKGIVLGYISVSNNYPANVTDHYIKVTASATITLLTPVGNAGRRFVIANKSGGNIFVTTNVGIIEGFSFNSSLITLPNGNNLVVFSDGTNWILETNFN